MYIVKTKKKLKINNKRLHVLEIGAHGQHHVVGGIGSGLPSNPLCELVRQLRGKGGKKKEKENININE